jgi:hypothetical protein
MHPEADRLRPPSWIRAIAKARDIWFGTGSTSVHACRLFRRVGMSPRLDLSVPAGVLASCRDAGSLARCRSCTAPPAWGYVLPGGSGSGSSGCSCRRGTCGRVCWRSTLGGGNDKIRRWWAIRPCARSWPRPGRGHSGSSTAWGRGRFCAGIPMPGSPPPAAAVLVWCEPGSRGGGGPWYRCGGTKAHSAWMAGD